jgi:pimeloyl-ACP methyl ester carboxylesterase
MVSRYDPSFLAQVYADGEPYPDAAVYTYVPYVSQGDAPRRQQLLVMLHGNGASPANYRQFMQRAATHGYHVVGLDWSHNGKSLEQVCGCYSYCYAEWHTMRITGGSHLGLEDVEYKDSLQGRLYHVLTWLRDHRPDEYWGQYLDYTQPGNIRWDKLAMAGHSQGSDLAAFVGRIRRVNRVIMMSGMEDRLGPASAVQGCSGCGSTLYHYGTENSIGVCTATTAWPPAWIEDNRFTMAWGTTGATSMSSYYGFADRLDTAVPWASIETNWKAIGLDRIHDAGFSDGWMDATVAMLSGNLGHYHALVAQGLCAPADGHAAHNQTANDTSACATSSRNANWDYMLTN